MKILLKIILIFKKPKIIIITGKGKDIAAQAVFYVLKNHYGAGTISFKLNLRSVFQKSVLIIARDSRDVGGLKWLAKKTKSIIFVVSNIGDISPDRNFFAGERSEVKQIAETIGLLQPKSSLILNFDDETVRELKNKTMVRCLTFGFQENAEVWAADVILTKFPFLGTNFKLNYQGNVVPIWLRNIFGKEQIYAALAAASVGCLMDLNLLEISEGLKSYESVPGRMKMINGIKNSLILDDSASATSFSMAEALDVLAGLPGRKIAVLGDIIGIGKYTVGAHEAMGERAARSADILFTFGSRAKFITKGALENGMAKEKIFEFNTIKDGKIKLQDEIREKDVILVDGSTEMNMKKIIDEIKA